MGGGTSTQTTETKPPAWAKPLFEQSATEAQNIYNSGAGGNVYQGKTVADLSPTTQAGIGQISNINPDTASTRPLFGSLGAAAMANPAMSGLSDVSNGLSDIAGGTTGIGNASQYQDVYDAAGQPTAASSYLTPYASGSIVGNNPYFNGALQNQLDQTAAQVQSQFSGAGRYGSGANTKVLTDQLGDIRTNALANQYNQDVANQLAAAGMIDQANQGALSTQLSAASGLSGVENQNIDNRLAAAGAQGNLLSNIGSMYSTGVGQALNATGAMSGLDQQNFENQLTAGNAQISAGGLEDQNAQNKLNAALSKWTSEDMEPWTRLGLLQSAAAGAAGNYGVNRQSVSQPSNPLGIVGALGSMAFK